jgi:hypothetical protein
MNKLAGFLGVLAMVAVAPLAQADLQILVNGALCTPTAGTNPLPDPNANGSLTCSAITVGGATISVLATQGLQAGNLAQQLGTTLLVENTTASAVTITIDIGVTNYASLNPPIAHSSGSTINGTTGTNSVTLTSCVNQMNNFFFCQTPAPGQAPPNGTLTVTGPSTAHNETTGTITSLPGQFALLQHIVLSAGAGGNFNVTTSQVLTSGTIPGNACPLTQGFWKNHFPGSWPSSVIANGLKIGSTTYTAAQLEANLQTPPEGGNALLILSHQLIAAELNILNGSNPAPIAATITAADALIDGLNINIDFVAAGSSLGQQMTALADTLDSFNSSTLTPTCTGPQ